VSTGGVCVKVPRPVIKRMPVYYRCLERLKNEGVKYVSSQKLARRLHLKDSQIRKDLSHFGKFGKRGVGYEVESLLNDITKILGLHKQWKVIVVGAGNIGKAIARFRALEKNNFKVVAVFDTDKRKIGTELLPGLKILDIANLRDFVSRERADLAILAVPASSAQAVANDLQKAGIRGILCFAPVTLSCAIPVEYVDITAFLKTLAYSVLTEKYNM